MSGSPFLPYLSLLLRPVNVCPRLGLGLRALRHFVLLRLRHQVHQPPPLIVRLLEGSACGADGPSTCLLLVRHAQPSWVPVRLSIKKKNKQKKKNKKRNRRGHMRT